MGVSACADNGGTKANGQRNTQLTGVEHNIASGDSVFYLSIRAEIAMMDAKDDSRKSRAVRSAFSSARLARASGLRSRLPELASADERGRRLCRTHRRIPDHCARHRAAARPLRDRIERRAQPQRRSLPLSPRGCRLGSARCWSVPGSALGRPTASRRGGTHRPAAPRVRREPDRPAERERPGAAPRLCLARSGGPGGIRCNPRSTARVAALRARRPSGVAAHDLAFR